MCVLWSLWELCGMTGDNNGLQTVWLHDKNYEKLGYVRTVVLNTLYRIQYGN
jgi:hypothetical protein